ncbi:hypothetical protein GCM10009111_25740 [Colwellia asteriadis]|uniref:DUF4150 domain-containing protein n=1 Tax=Colwellia asteriadis TaxID=517723 RepID=A0ABP3WI83_9GAMM
MTSYCNAGAGKQSQSIQYDIDSLSADVRSEGNQAWRHNNVALLPLNISARSHNVLGSAYGVAIFPTKADSQDAFITECERPKYGGFSLGDMVNEFIPDYIIPPPEWNDEKNEPILPWIEPVTGLGVNAELSDYATFLTLVEAHIGWEAGTTEPLEKDVEAEAPTVATVSGTNVLINGRTAVHADSGGVLQTIDVCMTPTPVSVIPIPYCNVAQSSDAASTASSVQINGNPACNLGSNFSQSTGDEAGTRKGIISGVTQGKAEFLIGSADVFIEGVCAVRQGDLMISNSKNTPPMPLNQPGGPMPRELGIESKAALLEKESGFSSSIIVYGVDREAVSLGHIVSKLGSTTQQRSLGNTDDVVGERAKISFEGVESTPYQPINYKIQGYLGELNIPLGMCETYSDDSPIADEDMATFINFKLKVFTESTLSTTLAKSPERLIVDQKGDVISPIHGYFYLFVNGYLWREIVALNDGMLSDVDLVAYYGEDKRLYKSMLCNTCMAPKKTIGLNNEGQSLTDAEVHIAYSPVQWSWAYITSLGGLYKNDPRQRLVDNPFFCQNPTAAKVLLESRCQKIDLEDAQLNKVVYVQDPVGIALNLLHKCQVNYLAVQEENNQIMAKPHFDSGVLAYQSMFNEDLQATTQVEHYFFPTKSSFEPIKTKKTVYKKRTTTAKFLRSGAKNIDKTFLEEYLSSDILEDNLKELPINQKALFDFIADKPKEEYSEPDKYITVENAFKDLVTLDGIDYLLGFKCLADIFNVMVFDGDNLGAFRPWMAAKEDEAIRLQNENIAKDSAREFIESGLSDDHWLIKYFTPPADLYDLSVEGHCPTKPSEKNDGSGKFRYADFQKVHEQLHKNNQDQESLLFNSELKVFLGSAKICVGAITEAWGRISRAYASGSLTIQTIKIRNIMVATNKATGISAHSDIHIRRAADVIGDSAGVVGITNYKRESVRRAERRKRAKQATKNPPANAVTITDAKGKVIAAHDPASFGTNKGEMLNTNWTDYNKLMGNYDLLEGELVVVPNKHRYAYLYANPKFKLGSADAIKINGVKALEAFLPKVMLAFEVFNATQLLAKFEAGNKVEGKFQAEIWGSVFILAAGSLEVAALYSSKIKEFYGRAFLGGALASRLTGFGILIGAGLSLIDSANAAKSQDNDAAFLHASAAVFSIAGLLFIGVAALSTPIGWALIVLGLVVTLMAVAFTDNNLEKWAINGPFSKNVAGRCIDDYKLWQTYPLECYAALRNELFSPTIDLSIQKIANQSYFLNIEIMTPGYIVGQSEIIMVVNLITDNGVLHAEKTRRVGHDNWRIIQHQNIDSIEENSNNEKLIGDPQITGFTYSVPFNASWGDDVEVDWQVKAQYCLDSHTTLPYIDKIERDKWAANKIPREDIPDKAWLIKEIEYDN